jgi:hypothetical protein
MPKRKPPSRAEIAQMANTDLIRFGDNCRRWAKQWSAEEISATANAFHTELVRFNKACSELERKIKWLERIHKKLLRAQAHNMLTSSIRRARRERKRD